MQPVAGKKFVIVGLGKSGIAAARFAVAEGARVIATDHLPLEQLPAAREALAHLPIEFHCGGFQAEDFAQADCVVVSPGVPLQLPELDIARSRGIPLIGEMELALPSISCPIVAITGTNGKSTTTTLIAQMLQAAGHRVVMGGNIGTPLLDLLSDLQQADYVVLEVSSYQLEITPSLRPTVAVLLNITPDHLDRYRNFGAYAAAKQIMINQLDERAILIYNGCDPIVATMARQSRAQGIAFQVNTPRWTFDAPALMGVHNRENLLAAAMAVDALGVSHDVIAAVAKEFRGLAHRCQLVTEWNGIRFFDDSKATNIGSVDRVLASFTTPVILIAGGQDKGTGYGPLREPIRRHVKLLILLGEAKTLMQSELGDCVETALVQDMREAVRVATERATSGDTVLLAPACASFDQYRNYAERGDDFARQVREVVHCHPEGEARRIS